MATTESSEDLRKKGNDAMHAGKFAEAVLLYTQAAMMDEDNHLVYSNRALAFLKLDQLYLAMQDAKKAIEIQPDWAKGYYRKGQVEHAAGYYPQALLSYRYALKLDENNPTIQDAIRTSSQEMIKERKAAARQPWLYVGSGLALGAVIVFADQFLTKSPSINSLILQLLLILVLGAGGYGVMLVYRYMARVHKRSMLEPPPDLLAEMEGRPKGQQSAPPPEESDASHSRRRRGGASAGRHKFQKGKS